MLLTEATGSYLEDPSRSHPLGRLQATVDFAASFATIKVVVVVKITVIELWSLVSSSGVKVGCSVTATKNDAALVVVGFGSFAD